MAWLGEDEGQGGDGGEPAAVSSQPPAAKHQPVQAQGAHHHQHTRPGG